MVRALRSAVIAVSIILASCSSGSVTPITYTNMSGDFGGSMSDAQAGPGTATATFAQHGNNVGGSITIVRSSGTVTAETSFTISSSNTIAGSLVIDYPTQQCTYTTTGSFDPNADVLTATYTAVTNCAGDTGSFSLTQQCSATATTGEARKSASIATRC
jgi:hypothetical protein